MSRHGLGLPAPRRASSMNCRRAMKRRLHACTSKVSTSAHARAAVAVACTASRAVAASRATTASRATATSHAAADTRAMSIAAASRAVAAAAWDTAAAAASRRTVDMASACWADSSRVTFCRMCG